MRLNRVESTWATGLLLQSQVSLAVGLTRGLSPLVVQTSERKQCNKKETKPTQADVPGLLLAPGHINQFGDFPLYVHQGGFPAA